MLYLHQQTRGITNMFNLKKSVKQALLNRDMSMTRLAELLGKDRASLTVSLYTGVASIATVRNVALELDYKLSEFIALGED